jgi:hypothetical protein
LTRIDYEEISEKGREKLHSDIRKRLSAEYDLSTGEVTIRGSADGWESGPEGTFYIFSDGVVEVRVLSRIVLRVLADDEVWE